MCDTCQQLINCKIFSSHKYKKNIDFLHSMLNAYYSSYLPDDDDIIGVINSDDDNIGVINSDDDV